MVRPQCVNGSEQSIDGSPGIQVEYDGALACPSAHAIFAANKPRRGRAAERLTIVGSSRRRPFGAPGHDSRTVGALDRDLPGRIRVRGHLCARPSFESGRALDPEHRALDAYR
jgi:hypothetical protein